jgi:polysaccharide export outer membrane protein
MITIRVLGEDDLKREKIRLSDAGTLSFPVLGEVQVKGMTVGALRISSLHDLRGATFLIRKSPSQSRSIETSS